MSSEKLSTQAEKEAKRLRRVLANRESARRTIRRRQVKCVVSIIGSGFTELFFTFICGVERKYSILLQALCEELTRKAIELSEENEKLKKVRIAHFILVIDI